MKNIYKSLLLLFSFHFSLFTVKAQEIEWQKTLGGNGWDIPYSILQTADGGYLFGGFSRSAISGDKTDSNRDTTLTTFDYWILKTDVLGNILWQKTIGGNGDDYLCSVIQTVDGGYILGGHSSSDISGDKTDNTVGNSGYYDYWIVKTDFLGNIQWQKTIGGNNEDRLWSMQQTTDGGYILGGYSNSDISGDKTENSNGSNDYWIVKTDSLCNIQWQNTIGGNGSDELYSIQQTVDGGFILGGNSQSNISGDKTESNCDIGQTTVDFWIVKTDSTGNILWQNTIGGNHHDFLSSVQQTTDGGYILGGTSYSEISCDKIESNHGGTYWVLKTDASGSIEWQQYFGGELTDKLKSIHQTTDGGYIIGGSSSSDIAFDKTESNIGSYSYNDYWIIKADSAGIIRWQNTIGGNYDDELIILKQTADGGYIVAGYSISDIYGDKTENSRGVWDYWIVKLSDKNNSITGKCFIDANINNMYDSGEVFLANKKVIEPNEGISAFVQQNGLYSILVLDSGSYSVTPEIVNHYNTVPVSYNVIFNGIHQTDSLNDFALQPSGVINDLRITLTPLTAFRSGFTASYVMHYENVGTTTLNASVVFYLNDSNYNYVSSSVSPFLITADSVVWSNISLAPFQSGDITVTVYVKPGLPISSQLNALCLINPLAGDAAQGDNWGSWKEFIVGSVDPNDIQVNKKQITTVQLANQLYLQYVIRFQNTGNDTCFNAKILNPIDTNKLELSSIEFVASSHPVNLKWIPWERNLEFKFDNILLADSNVNEPLSHGYIRYRIKPKTNLVAGDKIENYAAIYFDFNEPVLTNTAKTKIVLPKTYSSISISSCNSYLSPSGNYTWITTGTYMDTLVNVYGGDSIVTVNLTINNSTSSLLNINSCDNYTSPSGNYIWTISGIYHDTIPNVVGCDSLITINLSINNSLSLINVNTCSSYTSPSGNYTWTTTGIYLDTIPNTSGCDSVIVINLTINNSSSTINVTTCTGSYTSPSGNYTWSNSGVYYDTIPNAAGCDSLMMILLSVIAVDTTVTNNAPLLIANAAGAAYQWMYCDSVDIPGATNQNFTATANGAYAVMVTQNGCTDTSSCYVIINVGIAEQIFSSAIFVSPNPFNSELTVFSNQLKDKAELKIYDVFGRIVFTMPITTLHTKLETQNFSSGVYLVEVKTDKGSVMQKIIKK